MKALLPQKPTPTTISAPLDRRWISVGYAVFALALLLLATLQRADAFAGFPLALALLALLLVAAPLSGMMLGRGLAVQAGFHLAVRNFSQAHAERAARRLHLDGAVFGFAGERHDDAI